MTKRSLIALLLLGLAVTACDQIKLQPKPTTGQYARDLLYHVNQYRALNKLPDLEWDDHLAAMAREHSLDMLEQDTLSHDGFEHRFAYSGRSYCVENVGWNYPEPEEQLTGWQESPRHNQNMLDSRITSAGIAKVGGYVTFFACQ